MTTTDVAIVGAGTAGLAAYAAASKITDRVLLIERGPHGTTCARSGCMPSKLLIAAADARHQVEMAREFGVEVGEVRVRGSAVMDRVRSLRDRFVDSVLSYVEQIPAERRLSGEARFVGRNTLDVAGQRVASTAVIIATGSHPFIPDVLAGAGDRLLTTDTVFDLKTLPNSIAVVGGGAIGLELGQALYRLGVDMVLFEARSSLGSATDPDVAAAVDEIFCNELHVELDSRIQGVSRVDDGVMVRYRDRDGNQRERCFEYVLACAGRRPQLAGLDVENAALELDDRGLPIFDPATQQCQDSPVFIAGDVDGRRPILHESAADGRIAGYNAASYPNVRAHPRSPRFHITFTEPQIATVGCTYEELDRERGGVGTVDFTDQGRSRVMARNQGLGRLYGDRDSGLLVGGEMVGPAVEHLSHLLVWAIDSGMTIEQMLKRPFYHPVIEEGLRTALKDLRSDLQMGPPVEPECIDCGPGV